MSIPDAIETNAPRKRITARVILLVLAIMTSPLCCLGTTLLEAIIPEEMDYLSFFAAEVVVENDTGEILFVTPITTTRGYPQVIRQATSLKQCQIPVAPGDSVALSFDAADFPLDGMAVCRGEVDCRLLAHDFAAVNVEDYQALPALDDGWLEAAQGCKPFNVSLVLFPLLAMVPLGAFVAWVVLTVRNKRKIR